MSVDRADAVISREKWGHDFLVMDNESITMNIGGKDYITLVMLRQECIC